MGKFEVGQRVKVLTGLHIGAVGTIEKRSNRDEFDWQVRFSNQLMDWMSYREHELATAEAPAQPATGGGADAYGDKYDDLERFNAELDKLRSASTWYSYPLSKMYLDAIEWRDEARDAHKVMDAQKAELATLRTQLADANARAAAAEARIDMLRGDLENIYAGAESNSGRCIDCDSIKIVAYAALEADKRAAIETRQTAGE